MPLIIPLLIGIMRYFNINLTGIKTSNVWGLDLKKADTNQNQMTKLY